MHTAPLTSGIGPELTDGADETRCPVGDHEQRAAQTPGGEPPSQLEPVLEPFALAEADIEEHAFPVGGEAPGHQHAFLRSFRTDRQVVGSDQGAVTVSRPLRLPGPPSEPDVRVATHPALHDLMRWSSRSPSSAARPTARGCARPGSGSGSG